MTTMTTILNPTIQVRGKRDMNSSLVRQIAGAAVLALLLAGCSDRPRDAARSGLTAPTTVLRSSRGAELVFSCPAMPGIAKRSVAAGTSGDANRNGVVCDQRVGSQGRQRLLTTDDVLMPRTAARR